MRLAMMASLFLGGMLVILSHWPSERPQASQPARPPVIAPSEGMVLLIDLSGSMKGQKLELARQAIVGVADGMPDPDAVVGLRTFTTQSTAVVAPSRGGSPVIRGAVESLRANGGTNIGAALRGARDDTVGAGGAGRPWTWILVSDGEGNNPAADIEAARLVASRLPEVVCHCIGIELSRVGRDELEQIAAILNGRCWVVGRSGLGAAMSEAASLAGFGGPVTSGSAGSVGASGRDAWAWPAAGFVVVVVLLLATLGRGLFREGTYTLVLAGGAGALAWAGAEALLPSTGTTSTLIAFVQNAAYFMLAGLAFGTCLAASESMYLGAWGRARGTLAAAVPVGIVGGAVAGVVGQGLFTALAWTGSYSVSLGYVARSLGWAVAGALVGIAPGVVSRSRGRVLDGFFGGALGGSLGGGLFHGLMGMAGASPGPRLVALMSLGVAIGLMVRVVEEARKVAWLSILEGGPTGKQFILSKPVTSLGSHYSCDVVVAGLRGAAPRLEAEIRRTGESFTLVPVPGGSVTLDGEPLPGAAGLRSGVVVGVGPSRLSFVLRDGEPGTASGAASPAAEDDEDLPALHASEGTGEKRREAGEGTGEKRREAGECQAPKVPDIRFIDDAEDDSEDGVEFEPLQTRSPGPPDA